jgi:hypothetical protein
VPRSPNRRPGSIFSSSHAERNCSPMLHHRTHRFLYLLHGRTSPAPPLPIAPVHPQVPLSRRCPHRRRRSGTGSGGREADSWRRPHTAGAAATSSGSRGGGFPVELEQQALRRPAPLRADGCRAGAGPSTSPCPTWAAITTTASLGGGAGRAGGGAGVHNPASFPPRV